LVTLQVIVSCGFTVDRKNRHSTKMVSASSKKWQHTCRLSCLSV